MDYAMRINQKDLEIEVRGNDKFQVITLFGVAYQMGRMPPARAAAIAKVVEAVVDAVERHPDFPDGPEGAAAIIAEEFLELLREVNDGGPAARKIAEASHTAATCLRFMESMVPHEA